MKSPLVLVHGWAGSSSSWEPLSRHWDAETWDRVIAIDLPGSPLYRGSGNASISSAADELVRVMRSLDAPSVLVGHSLGAQVTLRAHTRAPELVRTEIVIDPAYGAVDDERESLRRWADRIARDGHTELLDFFSDALLGVDERSRAAVLDDLRSTPTDVIVGYLRSEYLDADAIGLMSATRRASAQRAQPVLAVHSDEGAATKARAIPMPPGSAVRQWTGYHHFLHLENPTRFVAEVTEWVQALVVPAARIPEYEES